MNAPLLFANGHKVDHAFELCDPLSPSLCPLGESEETGRGGGGGGGGDTGEGKQKRHSACCHRPLGPRGTRVKLQE